MFQNLKDKIAAAGEATKSAVGSAASAMSPKTQVNHVLDMMEAVAFQAKQRDAIKEFRVNATINLGFASVAIEADYHLDRLTENTIKEG